MTESDDLMFWLCPACGRRLSPLVFRCPCQGPEPERKPWEGGPADKKAKKRLNPT